MKPRAPEPLVRSHRETMGQRSEQLACRWLTARGYTIERRQVRFPVGEIDIVARDGHTLCFVEVRSTSSAQWGGPLATITDRKRRRLIRAARWHLQRLPQLPPFTRFDVVGIEWIPGSHPTIELIQGAFEAD